MVRSLQFLTSGSDSQPEKCSLVAEPSYPLYKSEVDLANGIATCGGIDAGLQPGETIFVGDILTRANHGAYLSYYEDLRGRIKQSDEMAVEKYGSKTFEFVEKYSKRDNDADWMTYDELVFGIRDQYGFTADDDAFGLIVDRLSQRIRANAFMHLFALDPKIPDKSAAVEKPPEKKFWEEPKVGVLVGAGAIGLAVGGGIGVLWGAFLLLRGAGFLAANTAQFLAAGLFLRGHFRSAILPGIFGFSRFGQWLSQTPKVPFLGRGMLALGWQLAAMPVTLLLIGAAVFGAAYGMNRLVSGGNDENSFLQRFTMKHIDPALRWLKL